MFVLALLHLLRVFFHASYKKPREGNWVVGAAMFLLRFLAVFTGTVLKWDQEGYEALIHNLDVAELLGGAGIWFTDKLTDRVSILLRLFNAHVVIVPGLIVLLFVRHALLIKRHRIPRIPRSRCRPSSRPSRSPPTSGAWPHSDSSCSGCCRCSACWCRPWSDQRRSKGSRSPVRCGCSGGSSRWRNGSGSHPSHGSSRASSD